MVFIFQVTLGRTVEGCCGCGALSVEIVAVGERVLWLGGLLMPTLAKERGSFSSLVWEDNVCRRTTTLVAPCHMIVVRLLELDWIVGKTKTKIKKEKNSIFFSLLPPDLLHLDMYIVHYYFSHYRLLQPTNKRCSFELTQNAHQI